MAQSDVWRHYSTHRKNVQQDVSCTGTGFGGDIPSHPDWDRLDWKFIQLLKNVRENKKHTLLLFQRCGKLVNDEELTLSLSSRHFMHRYNTYDRALAHVIETQVINWTNLIQKILKEDSSDHIPKASCNPGPSAELKFWASRASNIKHIYLQVHTPFPSDLQWIHFILCFVSWHFILCVCIRVPYLLSVCCFSL